MAREIKITIVADGSQARSELAKTDKSINQTEAEAQQLEKTFTITGAGVGKALAGVAVALAAIDFGGLAKHAAENASKIQDAMERMGIKSAAAVQRLAFAASQGGSSLQTVDTAIKEMAKSLTGDQAAEQLIADLGLNLQQLRTGAPDQTFLTLAEAVKGIANPLDQAKASLVLFGRSGTELLPAIKAGFVEVGKQAPLMSDALVAMGDTVGDKMDKIRGQFEAAQAQALLPFANFFLTYLPDSVQVGVAGISNFLPSLETLTLGIIAAGGPKVALTSLATLFGTTIPAAVATFVSGAGAAMVTFFTTTLPAAFGTIIAFLGPQGLIALGLLALAGIWYLFGDKITAVVQKVYGAVKTWLVDKFNSIVESVKGKIDAITGFFGEMYDSVVGHSFVPDMVTEIGQWFGKLDDLMVKPTEAAAGKVQGIFGQMANSIGGAIGSAILGGGGGIGRAIGSSAGGLIGGALGNLIPIPGVGALLGSVAGAGVQKLAGWIGGLFGQSKDNKHRDQTLKQFAGIDDLDQASDKVRELGFAAGVSDQEMRSLFSAKRIEDFDRIFGSVTDQIATFNLKTAQSLQVMKDELATPVVIPVTFGMIDPGLGGSGGTDMFSPRNFGSYSDWLQNWLGRNPNDAHRANEALGGQNPWGDVPQFADGGIVPGRGARRAIVHGGEGVLNPRGMAALEAMNRGQGAGTDTAALEAEVRGLRADIRRERSSKMADLRAMLQVARGMGLGRI